MTVHGGESHHRLLRGLRTLQLAHQPPTAHHQQPVGDPQQLGQLRGDEQDRLALSSEIAQQTIDISLGCNVDPSRRLVEDDELTVGQQRTGEKQLSIFLVERGAEGLEVGRNIEKMGVRASVTSEVSFEDVPATCLLGELHQGMGYLREVLAEIRVMTAALALGVARAALEDSLAYAAERQQFGRPINRFQSIQAHLAEMAVDLEAARQMTRWAAWRSDQGVPNEHEAAMAKLFASEAALRICDRAARILASYGFAKDYPVERYLRDVRFTLIGGGTSEILRVNIARGLKS